MIKKVAFFSPGFAFNRLNRMKFYEKIFPKNVQIYLITTDKYDFNREDNYQDKWDLSRSKKIKISNGFFKTPVLLRKFCSENSIDRITNLGAFPSSFTLLIATIFSKTNYLLNLYGSLYLLGQSKIRFIYRFFLFYFLSIFAEKVISVDHGDYLFFRKIYSKFFINPKKIFYLAAPVDTKLFSPINKEKARKKLNLPLNKKIIIYVGRISWGKCSDILINLIKSHQNLKFIVIGRAMDKNFKKLKLKNLVYFPKKYSDELSRYYAAADVGFFLHRQIGAGVGQTTAECLASGTPCIIPKRNGKIPSSKSLKQIKVEIQKSNDAISYLINKNKFESEKLSKEARKYALVHLSRKSWKNRYYKTYLG